MAPLTFDQIRALEEKHVLPVYQRYPIALERGEGVHVFDVDGRKYLDFVGGLGVNALGYAHPRIVKAIREEADKLIHTSNLYHHKYYGELAEQLCRLSGMDRVFLSNSGTEAIEGAIKLARAAGHKAGGEAKSGLVALEGSYHGRTFGAMSVTGQAKYRKEFEPMLGGNVGFVQRNDSAGLRRLVNDNTCAILMEPIQGEGGVRECSREFLAEARVLADKHGALLVLDEIQCGLGRTGGYFAYQDMGIVPDVVCVAKPLAGGLPLGAFLTRECFATMIPPGKHGTTFGGGPFACRVALEYFAVLKEEKLLENVRRIGAYMQQRFRGLVEEFAIVKETRGRGCMQSLELTVPARPIVEKALDHGMLFNSTQDVVLRFLPPFLIQEVHVDQTVTVLRKLLAEAG
ncbi:MAG: aspartate aminotransferase family protein [Acidobacteriales bacterium]|nr:aspartate aminotransferase family protein [Terriglobales bacterium]